MSSRHAGARIGRLAGLVALFTVLCPLASEATLNASSTAEVVHLRHDCTGVSDCGDDLVELTNWINTSRLPSASDPLLVLVGPGTHTGIFGCNLGTAGTGHVTFRGAGRTATTLSNAGSSLPLGVTFFAGVSVSGCEGIAFEDLTIEAKTYGVVWANGGSSRWTNVDIRALPPGNLVAWWEDGGIFCQSSDAVHYFFNTRILNTATATSTTANGFHAACGESWFFGGEITVDAEPGAAGGRNQAAVAAWNTGRLQVFGSVIRSFAGASAGSGFNTGVLGGSAGLLGVAVGVRGLSGAVAGGGTFHAHGANINADASATAGAHATSLLTANGGFAHTPGSSFVSRAGSGGQAHRLTNSGGTALSPFFWQGSEDPPESTPGGSLTVSEDGSDMFVETDCDENGVCEGSGLETHLMIMNAARCGTERWFDVVTGRCRNDDGS